MVAVSGTRVVEVQRQVCCRKKTYDKVWSAFAHCGLGRPNRSIDLSGYHAGMGTSMRVEEYEG